MTGVRDWSRPSVAATGEIFDAVIVPSSVGVDALHLLLTRGAPLGPTIASRRKGKAAFLVAPGSRETFDGLVTADGAGRVDFHYRGAGGFIILPALLPGYEAVSDWLVPPEPWVWSRLEFLAAALVMATRSPVNASMAALGAAGEVGADG